MTKNKDKFISFSMTQAKNFLVHPHALNKRTLSEILKGKVIPLQARCGPEGGQRHSSTLPQPWHQQGVSGQQHAPAALYPWERPLCEAHTYHSAVWPADQASGQVVHLQSIHQYLSPLQDAVEFPHGHCGAKICNKMKSLKLIHNFTQHYNSFLRRITIFIL